MADPVLVEVRLLRGPVDLVTVDALARLRLLAGRLGVELRLHTDDDELRSLLLLTGLAEALD